MPIVKKIKVDIEGNGELTIINISIDSEGKFSANVPMNIRSVCNETVSNELTMHDAIKKVSDMISKYQQTITTEEFVLLVDFKRHHQPFINEGIHMGLNYMIAQKKSRGSNVRYTYCVNENGNIRVIGNSVTFDSGNGDKGIKIGKCLELKYNEEQYNKLCMLNEKLHILADALEEFTSSEDKIMELFSGSLKLLS